MIRPRRPRVIPALFESGGPQAAPVEDADRLVALDALRGFVLLGILVMNIQSFAMPVAAYANPTAYGDLTGANLWVWIVSHVLFDQKFMAVFSMLFGAGIVLMSARAGEEAARLHHRRMAWLVVFGLLHAYLFWYGDILYTYGLCGFAAFAFRERGPGFLAAAGLVLLMMGTAAPIIADRTLTPEQFAEVRAEEWQPEASVIAAELAAYRGGFISQSRHRAAESLDIQTTYFVLVFGWRVLGLMLLGMALFKAGLFSGRLAPSTHAALTAGGFLIGVPIVIHGMRQHFAHGWSVEYSLFLGSLWNYWGSVFVAIGYAGVVAGVVRAGILQALMARLAAVGRMAFSNYILQTLIATTIFYGHGLGLFGSVPRTTQIAIVVAIWAVLLIVSPWWLRRYRFGPLEWLWRSLTYGQRMQNTEYRTQNPAR